MDDLEALAETDDEAGVGFELADESDIGAAKAIDLDAVGNLGLDGEVGLDLFERRLAGHIEGDAGRAEGGAAAAHGADVEVIGAVEDVDGILGEAAAAARRGQSGEDAEFHLGRLLFGEDPNPVRGAVLVLRAGFADGDRLALEIGGEQVAHQVLLGNDVAELEDDIELVVPVAEFGAEQLERGGVDPQRLGDRDHLSGTVVDAFGDGEGVGFAAGPGFARPELQGARALPEDAARYLGVERDGRVAHPGLQFRRRDHGVREAELEGLRAGERRFVEQLGGGRGGGGPGGGAAGTQHGPGVDEQEEAAENEPAVAPSRSEQRTEGGFVCHAGQCTGRL